MPDIDDETLDQIIMSGAEDSVVREALRGVPRKRLLRRARDHQKRSDELSQQIAVLQQKGRDIEYSPLYGGASSPTLALERKYALVNKMRAWFGDSDDSAWNEMTEDVLASDVFAISRPIEAMIRSAAESLPDDVMLHGDDLPYPSGLIMGEDRLFGGQADVLFWDGHGHEGTERSYEYGVTAFIEYRQHPQYLWTATSWPVGYPITELQHDEETKAANITPEHELEQRRFFAAFCYFVKQRILTESRERADRPARRRAEREGRNPEESIRVVQLRASEVHSYGDERDRSFEYSVRWIVRGHWRNQYHPSTGRHEPKWIMPYVKGPDGAPVKNPVRLFSVSR